MINSIWVPLNRAHQTELITVIFKIIFSPFISKTGQKKVYFRHKITPMTKIRTESIKTFFDGNMEKHKYRQHSIIRRPSVAGKK